MSQHQFKLKHLKGMCAGADLLAEGRFIYNAASGFTFVVSGGMGQRDGSPVSVIPIGAQRSRHSDHTVPQKHPWPHSLGLSAHFTRRSLSLSCLPLSPDSSQPWPCPNLLSQVTSQ